jgi:hypothetical protein
MDQGPGQASGKEEEQKRSQNQEDQADGNNHITGVTGWGV